MNGINITVNGSNNAGFVQNGGSIVGVQTNNYSYHYGYRWPLFYLRAF